MKTIMITNDTGFLISIKEFAAIKERIEIALFIINNSVYIPLYTHN